MAEGNQIKLSNFPKILQGGAGEGGIDGEEHDKHIEHAFEPTVLCYYYLIHKTLLRVVMDVVAVADPMFALGYRFRLGLLLVLLIPSKALVDLF